MEASMNLLSSSSPFLSRTHLGITTPSSCLSVSVLHEQTSVIPSTPTTSVWRQLSSSVLSLEQRDECRSSLPIVREDRTSQSTFDRKTVDDGAFVQEHMGTSGQHLGDLEDQLFHWSGLSSILLSLENEERPFSAPMDKLMDVTSCDVISLAQEAVSASKQALSLAEGSDVLGADSDGPLSIRLNENIEVKQKRVMSTRLLERRSKKRRSSKPNVIQTIGSSEKAERRKSSEGVDPNDPLRLFLSRPETTQLLTIQEEKELIRKIQAYNKLVEVKRKLESQFGREPTYAEWAGAVGLNSSALRSEVHSWKRRQDRLIYANFRLVVYIAKQYQGRGLSLQDLLQEGSMGLMRSVEKFKPQAGCRFPSYAYWWIRQSIRKAIFRHSRTIRVPENMFTLMRKVLEARKLFVQEGHYHPTAEELAQRVEITVEKLQNLMILMRHPVSMQQPVWIDQHTTFQEVTENTTIETPDICVGRQMMRKHIRNLVGTLTPREEQIIKMRFGIGAGSGEKTSLSEIGVMFGLSKERVRQIESRALDKLKESLNSHGLNAYADLLV